MVQEFHATHLAPPGSFASAPGFSLERPLARIEPGILGRMTEDSDEWDSFLRYNQAILEHQFKMEDWTCNQQNYERTLDLWSQHSPTEEQIKDLANFRYRKRWKCHYSPTGETNQQPPVRTHGSTSNGLYPNPNLHSSSLEPRVLSLKEPLTKIFDGVESSRFLQMAIDGGWLRRLGSREMDCAGLDYCHAGYYGSRGNFYHCGLRSHTNSSFFRCFEDFSNPEF